MEEAAARAAGAGGRPGRTALLTGYWRSPHWPAAYALLAGVAAMTLAAAGASVVFSYWMAKFFTAMQHRDSAVLQSLLPSALGVFALIAVASVAETQLRMTLQIRWREWLTLAFIRRYCAGYAFYDLSDGRYEIENPDQRITEDIRLLTSETVLFGTELLGATARLLSFIVVLWSASGSLVFQVMGHRIEIPGYMVLVAFLYTALTTYLGHLIGRPLGRLNFEQQQREATLRFALMRVRENAESIALMGGGRREATLLEQHFANVRQNFFGLITYTKRLHGYQAVNGLLVGIFPFLAAAPRFLSGKIELGGFMQIASAFQTVHGSLNWFLGAYERLATWKASLDRAVLLEAALAGAEAERMRHERATRSSETSLFALRRLNVALPSGRTILRNVELRVQPGERVLLTGPSGVGKSALFRVLAGVSLWSDGEIGRPSTGVVFLPQKPYLPVGRLREVLAYPAEETHVDDGEAAACLTAVGLEDLIPRLDQQAQWHTILSLGEQQRLAIVRAVLQRPQWLLLDEASSGLDGDSESRAYKLLSRSLPDATIVTIAHRGTLKAFHRRQLVLDRSGSLHDSPITATNDKVYTDG